MKCFFHSDIDGRAAANLVLQNTKYIKPAESDFISMNYIKPLPVELVAENELVFIVDYSFTEATKDQLDALLKKTKNIVWLDHHASSIDFVLAHPEYLDIIVNNRLSTYACGAKLAYQFFNPNEPIPTYIELIDDFDRWIHSYKESMSFKLYMDSVDHDPFSTVWNNVNHETMIHEMIERGEAIQTYSNMSNSKDFNRLGYESKIGIGDGKYIKCIVMNKPGNSTALCDALTKYDIGVVWQFDGSVFSYSLYSTNAQIKCNKIAERRGGGGHPGAARFTSNKMEFVKI